MGWKTNDHNTQKYNKNTITTNRANRSDSDRPMVLVRAHVLFNVLQVSFTIIQSGVVKVIFRLTCKLR